MTRQTCINTLKAGCFICLLFAFSSHSFCQTNRSNHPTFFSISPYIGKFQVHTKSLYPYNGTHPMGIELEVSRLLLSENIREKFGTYIKWGIGLNYVNFNHEDLGYGITSLAYIEPFIKTGGQWRFSAKLGAGLAYMSNPYDNLNNPQNLTYSSHLAFPLQAGANAYYFITKQWAIKANASFHHISNGGIKQPNLGINYPVIAIGVEHTPNIYSIPPKRVLHKHTKDKRFEILLGYSLKEDTTNTNNQHVVTLFTNYSFQVSRINALTISGYAEYQQINNNTESEYQISIAPLFGNEFLFGQLFFGQQLGAYILKADGQSHWLLQNYYLRYKINSHLTAGVNLKAHGRVADYLSFQFGFIF